MRARRFGVLGIAVLLCAGCGERTTPPAGATAGRAGGGAAGGGAGGRGKVQFPVEVAPVETRSVEYTLSAVGSVEAFEVVQVTARVSGVVDAVRFREGDRVKPQQVLVEIEPERYRLAVDAGKANLEKAAASKAEADAGLARREGATAKNPGIIPGEEIETWRTRVRTAEAGVAQARTALDEAELNLRDAYVRAPVGGTIQTRTAQTGQYAQPGVPLATLLRRDPLLLRFQIPEPDAGQVRPGMRARFKVRESQVDFEATITHVATSADAATRMVPVTAQVNATAGEPPRPGAFAEVRVPVGASVNSAVVPETAVRPSERGFLAYVIENDVARERVLALGMRTEDGRVEVRKGLQAGEMLVVRGAEALREGAPVRVVEPKSGAVRAPGAVPAPSGAASSSNNPAPGTRGSSRGTP